MYIKNLKDKEISKLKLLISKTELIIEGKELDRKINDNLPDMPFYYIPIILIIFIIAFIIDCLTSFIFELCDKTENKEQRYKRTGHNIPHYYSMCFYTSDLRKYKNRLNKLQNSTDCFIYEKI